MLLVSLVLPSVKNKEFSGNLLVSKTIFIGHLLYPRLRNWIFFFYLILIPLNLNEKSEAV